MIDPHKEVKRLFDEITSEWPDSTQIPGPRDLPPMDDLEAILRDLPDDIDLPSFPEHIPPVDPAELTSHARRVLGAIGDFQNSKPRTRNKKSGESALKRRKSHNAIATMSLDKKREAREMTNENCVILSGTVAEQPSRSETEDGRPTAMFWLRVPHRWIGKASQECEQEQFFRVHVVGHPANSIVKYWYPNIRVTVTGELRTYGTTDGTPRNEMYVHGHTVGYLSVSPIIQNERLHAQSV